MPAGRYLVSQPLRVAGANRTNATTGVVENITSLHMEGDGMAVTSIVASAEMFAVITYPTCCGDMAPTTTHQYLGKMTISGNGAADYGVQGSAVTGSLFEELYVQDSLVAGIYMGFGYNVKILNCECESNYMGIVVMNADNNGAHTHNSVYRAGHRFAQGLGVAHRCSAVRSAGGAFRAPGQCSWHLYRRWTGRQGDRM